MRYIYLILFLAFTSINASEVIPPAPTEYFNDYAGVTHASTRQELNQLLENFERETSNQVVVAIFQQMQTDSSIEDYTVRIAQKWGVGQKNKSNGAILFLFVQNRKLYIQVGYGLEGSLTDALCRRIIQNDIVPNLKRGNYDQGLKEGVSAIIKATRGEYQGTGITHADTNHRESASGTPPFGLFIGIFVFILLVTISKSNSRRGYYYSGSGTSTWGGSSWGGGSGGSFSGGGGSFGGGGSGGSW